MVESTPPGETVAQEGETEWWSPRRLGLGSPLTDRRSALLLVGVVAVAVYLNSLPNLFAYDDLHIIQNNTAIHSLETLPGALIQPYWTGHYGRELGLWRPVATALFGIQWILSDGQPLLFHVVNVAMHAAASLLVVLLLLELMPLAAAFAGGLVFAVHPVHVEAVSNVIGLSELISTACVLGACLVHIRGGERSTWSTSLGVGLLYALGIGSKESAITLPALILLVDAARRHVDFAELPRYIGHRWKVYGVMLVVSLAMLAGRYAILGSIAAPFAPLGADLLLEIPRIWTLGEIWLHYVRLWVFPLDLASDYSPGVIPISFQWGLDNTIGAGLALSVLALALVAWRRPPMESGRDTARTAAFGVVWFMIAISPTSNTLFLSGILLSERTLYLPSVGLAAATGWLIVRVARERKRAAWVGLTVIVMLSSVRVWTRNPTWRDTLTVLATLMEDYPHSGRTQWILGDQFIRQGRPSQGLLSYRAAIDLLGTHYALSTEIARVLMEEGLYDPAEVLLKFAAGDQPKLPLAYALLSLVEAERGHPKASEQYARQSLAIEAADPTRRHLLAWALAAQGRIGEAREARASAEEIGQALFWQQYMYHAHVRWAEGDTAGAYLALDSAATTVRSALGRATLDSVRVAEFGLQPLGGEGMAGNESGR